MGQTLIQWRWTDLTRLLGIKNQIQFGELQTSDVFAHIFIICAGNVPDFPKWFKGQKNNDLQGNHKIQWLIITFPGQKTYSGFRK